MFSFVVYMKRNIPAQWEYFTTVIYLASPLSSGVNGMNIAVEGGYTCI